MPQMRLESKFELRRRGNVTVVIFESPKVIPGVFQERVVLGNERHRITLRNVTITENGGKMVLSTTETPVISEVIDP